MINMDQKTTKEKPNYVLHYNAKCRDDNINCDYHFNASDDDKARETALHFIEEHDRSDKQAIDSREKSWQDLIIHVPLKLERIAYVMREFEERTEVSLEGDVTSRLRNDGIVELSDLAHL